MPDASLRASAVDYGFRVAPVVGSARGQQNIYVDTDSTIESEYKNVAPFGRSEYHFAK